MASKDGPVPAAGYIRMSTDKQQDSPERQRADITALAGREGFRVVRWYEDHGKTGTESKRRPDFQAMLRDAQAGAFSAVLLSEQSRMSREDLFDVIGHWKLLRDAGVTVVTCQRGRLDFDTLGGLITSIVDAHGAHDESRKIAERSASGKRQAVARKAWIAGGVFGYDRVITNDRGDEVARVHFRDRYQKPKNCRAALDVSRDAAAVGALREAFESVARGESLAAVTRRLNGRVRSARGCVFLVADVTRLLSNPIYKGTARHGTSGKRAKFCKAFPDGPVEVPAVAPALVPADLFDAVQAVLKARHRKRTRAKPGSYLLAGLIRCGTCGNKLYGITVGVRRGRTKAPPPRYGCVPPSKVCRQAAVAGTAIVRHVTVGVQLVERCVVEAIRTRVLAPENRRRIAEQVAARKDDAGRTPDELQLAEIQADITRAEKNLTRADSDEDYAAISRGLRELRQQAETVRNRVRAAATQNVRLTGDAAAVIQRLEWLCDNFHKAPRPQLADALKLVIADVVVTRLDIGSDSDGRRMMAAAGAIHFTPDIHPDPVVIPTATLSAPMGHSSRLKEILDYLRRTGGGKLMKDIIEDLGLTNYAVVRRNLTKAVALGLVERVAVGKERPRWRAV